MRLKLMVQKIDKRLFYLFVAVLLVVIIRLVYEADWGNLAIVVAACLPFVQDLYRASRAEDE